MGLGIPLLGLTLGGCVFGDECDGPDHVECDGAIAKTCGVQVSDAHKAGNPYIWRTKDCGSAELCKIDTMYGSPVAVCVLTPDVLPRCTTSESSYLCIGDFAVECTDSGYGAALSGRSDPEDLFSCKNCKEHSGYPQCQDDAS